MLTSTDNELRSSQSDVGHSGRGRGAATVLVLSGTLTITAGATVAPAVPGIREAFSRVAHVDLLARMITTTHALAIVLFARVAGILVERVRGRRSLLLGMAAFAVVGSSGSYLPSLYGILAGRVVLGIGVSLVMISSMAMVADLYEGAERQKLFGRQTAAGAFGGVVLLLGGGAPAELDWHVVFLVYLLGGVLAVPAFLSLPRRGEKPPAEAPTAQEPSGAGPPKASKGIPAGVLAALAAMTLGQIAFYVVPVQLPFLIEDHFHAGSLVSGGIIAVQTLVTGLVSLRFAFFRRLAGEHLLVALSFLVMGVGFVVLTLAPHVAVPALGMVLLGTGLGVLMPTLNSWVLSEAFTQVRGRYAGFLTTALFLGQFAAPAVVVAAGYALGGRRRRTA
ncbi:MULTISPECIES: MFS transporter [Streptomyces]|uniref:MFS transporter n=1 Tax=Streptomyces TaxID=1883 RepID=UPI002E328F06|nr:MFS transporter [Streptomyces canus]